MGIQREFQRAIESEFGSAGNQYNIGAGTGTTTVLVSLGPTEVYDWMCGAQSATSAKMYLLDASATGEGSSVRWVHRLTATNPAHYQFARPLIFEKGLVFQFTATGTATEFTTNINYSGTTKAAGSKTSG